MGKVADAGKGAVTKTNEVVSNAVESRREKKEEKLTQKIEETRAELKDDGFIELTPTMIALPEFEEERMAVDGRGTRYLGRPRRPHANFKQGRST